MDTFESYELNTGGGCMVRVINMDGYVLILNEEFITKYKTVDDFWAETDGELHCEGIISLPDFVPANPYGDPE